jgi:hypothetical protein
MSYVIGCVAPSTGKWSLQKSSHFSTTKERFSALLQFGEGEEFIIYVYCRLLSQVITHTEVVMQKGTISYEVITLNIQMTKEIPPRVGRCSSGNELDLTAGMGALFGTVQVPWLSSAFPLLVNQLRSPLTTSLSNCPSF